MDALIPVVAAVASIVAAVTAGVFALASRRLEARLRRSEQAHQRILERKHEMYEPIVNLLEHMFTSSEIPGEDQLRHKEHFDTWVNIFGSDGVVRSYSRLLQSFPLDPPADIQFRLYADFLLALRKDIGDPDTDVDRMQILGPRLAHLPDSRNLSDPDIDAVCARLGWTPPWKTNT